MTELLTLFAIVLGINLLPAFGPPTWSIIVIYGLNTKMPLVALIVAAALAAALGRYMLAHFCHSLRGHLPSRMKRNAEAAGRAIGRRKRHTILALGLFALSPLPSAQLFEAAGLSGVRLFPFTCAFFAGRLVTYSVYGLSAKRIQLTTLGETFRHSFTSPLGLALQIAMLALLVGLTQIDWEKRFGGEPSKLE